MSLANRASRNGRRICGASWPRRGCRWGWLSCLRAFSDRAQQVLEILRVHAHIPLLAGCSSQSLINGDHEVEKDAGLTLGLWRMPGADLRAVHFSQEQVEEANGPGYWHLETGVEPDRSNGWLTFINPFHLDSETWLRTWNEAYAPLPVLGGLASGESDAQATQVYLNGEVYSEGGVAISVGGAVRVVGVTSQACTPIGQTWDLPRWSRTSSTESATGPPMKCWPRPSTNSPTNRKPPAAISLSAWWLTNTWRISSAAIS